MGITVEWDDLEMPPSSNNQYILVRRGGKTFHVPSAKLKAYQNTMNSYPYRMKSFPSDQKRISEWIQLGYKLEVNALFLFHRKSLFTVDGRVKKMDVSNRLKALHDSLAKLIGVDDSTFFRVSAEKSEIDAEKPESVIVKIKPFLIETPLRPA